MLPIASAKENEPKHKRKHKLRIKLNYNFIIVLNSKFQSSIYLYNINAINNYAFTIDIIICN